MRFIMCILLVMFTATLFAGWDWAHSIGGADAERSWDIACDLQNNIFVAGDHTGTLLVNGQSYPGQGLLDSFVVKYSPGGEVQWVQCFGSTNEDVALGVDTDAQGNCYVGGYFTDTFSCQGQSVTSIGLWDVYVLKFNPQGNLMWLRTFGGPLNDIGYGLAVNASGNVFVAGWFADTIKFAGGDSITSAGGSDVYCCAYDTNGNFLWARSAGTAGVDYGYKVACDNYNNAYVTGVAGAGSVFGTLILPTDGMFVAKYNALGVEQWLASSVNTPVISISVQAELNGTQHGMVCGRVVGTGSIGSFVFNSLEGGDDIYWAQFDAVSGAWDFMDYYGGVLSDKGRDCDYEAYPAFIGTYEGVADFNGQDFSSIGESDLIIGFGNTITPQWITTGGANSEVPSAIKILPNGKLAISGWHYGLGNIGLHAIDTGDIANQNAFVACFNPFSAVDDELSPAPVMSASPNPFTEILLVNGSKLPPHTLLSVYNIKGQLVNTLYPDTDKNYHWDGRDSRDTNCSAGIYLIKAGNSSRRVLKLN